MCVEHVLDVYWMCVGRVLDVCWMCVYVACEFDTFFFCYSTITQFNSFFPDCAFSGCELCDYS
jgi:hypothetical protein